jgi:hypothetical protein
MFQPHIQLLACITILSWDTFISWPPECIFRHTHNWHHQCMLAGTSQFQRLVITAEAQAHKSFLAGGRLSQGLRADHNRSRRLSLRQRAGKGWYRANLFHLKQSLIVERHPAALLRGHIQARSTSSLVAHS